MKSARTQRSLDELVSKIWPDEDVDVLETLVKEFTREFEETEPRFEIDDFAFFRVEASVCGYLTKAQLHAYEEFVPKLSYYLTTDDEFIKVWR